MNVLYRGWWRFLMDLRPLARFLADRGPLSAAEALKAKWGYDQPVYVQYYLWLGNLLQGDLATTPGLLSEHLDHESTNKQAVELLVSDK